MIENLPPYLEMLNPEQREAVLHTGKSLLILAGAGSGKTRVITTKIAYLIRERGLDPRSILAVTFTNKAAAEMSERAYLIEPRARYAMLRTFHSFGAWFLRRYASLAGISSSFTVYDEDDMVSLLSALVKEQGGSTGQAGSGGKGGGASHSLADVKLFAHQISRAKDYFLGPDDPELKLINYRKDFQKIYKRYEERLKEIGNADFGDLIKKPVEILRENPSVAQIMRDRFRVIMVDEYQDANIAQFTLLKELAGPDTHICVVGDDDQSIYRFRGAEVRNILEFPERFPNTDIIKLERNYRSTEPILKLASSVVDKNKDRLGKTLKAERGGGKLPVLAFLPNQDEEAAFAAEVIEASVNPKPAKARSGVAKPAGAAKDGPMKPQGSPETAKSGAAAGAAGPEKKVSYSDWAILYRTNAQSLGFETEFLRRRIPYRVVGSLKFYEREEIKDALALLSFLVNPRDEVAFRRVVNKPARGVGGVTIDKIVAEAASSISAGQASVGDLLASSRRLMPALAAKARAGIQAFAAAIEAGRACLSALPPAGEDLPAAALADPAIEIPADAGGGRDWGQTPAAADAGHLGGTDTPKGQTPAVDIPVGTDTVVAGGRDRYPAGQTAAGTDAGHPGGADTPEGQIPAVVGTAADARLKGKHGKKESLSAGEGLSLCAVTLLKESGIVAYHIENDEIAGNQRVANLQELANAASIYPATQTGLLEFLEHIELDRSMEEKENTDLDAVTLITLHNTKGLEFKRVIITGVERGVFPRDDKKDDELEEERRLFYVGATRAMDELYFTSCAMRRMFGQTLPMEPSIFLNEIDKTALRIIGRAPYGFQPTSPSKARSTNQATGKPATDAGGWKQGDRLFHDDQGYGVVTEIRAHGNEPILVVRFETGKELSFLSRHQSSKITKIED
jgi:DNA helicase-2/ATP-dependent DNA helicase PcrA